MKKVVLGISGGVDSAVAALLLRRAGFDPVGVYLKSGLGIDEEAAAAAAASRADIPFYTVDITDALEQHVCSYFVKAYCAGLTPSPCIVCNPTVKFAMLFRFAEQVGAEFVSTGHYAGVDTLPTGERAIFAGVGRSDQSYMLCRLDPACYSRLVFPLGKLDKTAVRAFAAEQNIPSADKPDSMEICFIPSGDRIGFVEQRLKGDEVLSGNFVDGDGNVIAPHKGLHCYTVGQRKRLGVALGYPVYVSHIDPSNGNITLLPAGGEYAERIAINGCLWCRALPDSFEADVRVRHSLGFTRGIVTKKEDGAEIVFPEGIRAPAPGQFAVCYIDGAVAGSGVIL